MSDMDRRDALKILASVPIAGGLMWAPPEVEAAWAKSQVARAAVEAGDAFVPTFFTEHEWATVRMLVDLIIPADDRSGSATDAGVPEFMDFIVDDNESMQIPIRGGLAWMDRECRSRFGNAFIECSDDERAAFLGDIAWPARAPVEYAHGVAFFNRFRDLTASGFFSSRVGVDDLQYTGNRVVREWTGCPDEVQRHMGVSYEEWDAAYGALADEWSPDGAHDTHDATHERHDHE